MIETKRVPLVMYKDGRRIVIGEADVYLKQHIVEVEAKIVPGDVEDEIVVSAQLNSRHRDLFSSPASEMSFSIPASFAKPPCEWKNSNICVAEGCFGESCLKEIP